MPGGCDEIGRHGGEGSHDEAPLALRGDYADTVRQAARSAYEFLRAAVAVGPRA
ncbi:MAG: hypothetical protein ACYCPO_03235 [Acidobacteriaceae bacterium]